MFTKSIMISWSEYMRRRCPGGHAELNQEDHNKVVTLVLNNAFKKRLIVEGKWNRDTKVKMRVKYYISLKQHKALKACV